MKDEQLLALDIVNPFTKEIKTDGINELIRRCNEYNCYDKVGYWFYTIEDIMNGDMSRPDNFSDYVVEWLNHIDSLKYTKKTLNFRLELFK